MKNKIIYVLTAGWPTYKILGFFDNKKTPLKLKNKHNKKYFYRMEIEEFILNKFG